MLSFKYMFRLGLIKLLKKTEIAAYSPDMKKNVDASDRYKFYEKQVNWF